MAISVCSVSTSVVWFRSHTSVTNRSQHTHIAWEESRMKAACHQQFGHPDSQGCGVSRAMYTESTLIAHYYIALCVHWNHASSALLSYPDQKLSYDNTVAAQISSHQRFQEHIAILGLQPRQSVVETTKPCSLFACMHCASHCQLPGLCSTTIHPSPHMGA